MSAAPPPFVPLLRHGRTGERSAACGHVFSTLRLSAAAAAAAAQGLSTAHNEARAVMRRTSVRPVFGGSRAVVQGIRVGLR